VGGHYAPSDTATSVNRRIVLPVNLRCVVAEIALPFYDERSEASLRLSVEGGAFAKDGLEECQARPSSGFVRASLPYSADTERKKVILAGESGLRFEGTWDERVPPRSVTTTLRGIGVSWRRHCLYADDEACPAARLLDSGYWCRLKEQA